MAEVSPRERQYETTETINIGALKDDFSVKDIKEINEGELQNFLMGDPVPEIDEDEKVRKVAPVEDTPEEDDIPAVKSTKKKEVKVDNEDVDEYLTPKTKKKPVQTNTNSTEEAEEDENIFSTLDKDLVKSGIFSEEDDTVKDAETFKQRFAKEMHKGANSIIEQFLSQNGPEYRDAFQAIFVDGLDPKTYFKQVDRIDNLENLDIKTLDNQERVLRNFYKAKGYSDTRIDKKIDSLKNFGEIEDEATEAHSILIKEENERLEEERERAQYEVHKRAQNKQNYKSSISKLLSEKIKDKSFDGIPVDDSIASRIFNNLTQDAYSLPDGRLITEFDKSILDLDRPENFEKKLKLAFLLSNDLDLSKIKREAIKNESSDAFEGIQRRKAKREIPSANDMKSFF